MNKLASASKSWAQLADIGAERAMRAEVEIRRELSAEELRVLDRLPLERQAQLLCQALSPWNGGSVGYFKRQLAIISNTSKL